MNWNRWTEYFFSLLGLMVGYGNVWRFPFICYKSGGGAFLLPYLIRMVFFATPLVFLEQALPIYPVPLRRQVECATLLDVLELVPPLTRWCWSPTLGDEGAWQLGGSSELPLDTLAVPSRKLVAGDLPSMGYAWFLLALGGTAYYNILICWTLYYLYSSFSAVLPWTTCSNSWNTPSCVARTLGRNNTSAYNGSLPSNPLSTVLNISDGIEHPGDIQLHLLVSQIVAWLVVFLCLVKGIRSVGKVVYVSATVPYVLLLALLIRGLMLPGAVEGIKAFIIPRWEKLLTLQAGAESTISLGVGVVAA
ncbi:sodium- and chloride-dependent GABA transporter 2-like [Gigantopelta aegis]|uniref:sodium- and chloride-dependent GABA transporter 2-like n=1 Tax=Gigantopelta aegis TaxID=1735272 RepID=UPI001B88C443|nr:sodium- and chloride-dependent GABA transporter 2-like [Gigantopelta aegis]